MTLQSGALLQNRYRIEGLLGRGGMGAVYKAIDTRLGNVVAIKQNLLESNALAEQGTEHDEEWSDLRRAQFEREARLLASLRHPGLAKVTDYFFISGEGQYLVMEFVEGQDFSTILKQMGPLHEDQAIGFTIDVCEVLDYLHKQSPPVIHRDIKPANIRITSHGQVVLVDFGVAKVGTTDHTTIGARAVTPGFSPLEQFGGDQRTDERSDIYSLGATLCALLTGKAPTAATERLMDSTRRSPVEEVVTSMTPALKSVLAKSLELKPEDRFQNAREFRTALMELLEGRTVKQAPFDRATLVDKVTMLRPAATVATKRPGDSQSSSPSSSPSSHPPSGPTGSPTAAAPPPPPPPVPPTAPSTSQPQPAGPWAAPTAPGMPPSQPTPTGGWAPTEPVRAKGAPAWIWPVLALIISLAGLFVVFVLPKMQGGKGPSGPAAVVLAGDPEATTNSVTLMWSPSNDTDFREYEIYYGNAPGFPVTPARKYGESITNVTNSRAVVEGLDCGTSYYFKIRVVTNSGASSVSDEMPARTEPCGSGTGSLFTQATPPDTEGTTAATGTNPPAETPVTSTPPAEERTPPAETKTPPVETKKPPVEEKKPEKLPPQSTTKEPAKTSTSEPPRTSTNETPLTTPAPTPTPPPAPVLPAEVVVAPSGGNFTTVTAAVEAIYSAKDATRRTLVLRPGRYVLPERIILGKNLQIRGEGSRSGIVLEASTAQVIFVEGQGGVVRGVTIRSGTSSAVSVAGEAVFEDCDISATAQSAVNVYGRGSVTLRRCILNGSGGKGVYAFKGGRATLDGCTLDSNKGGVEATENAEITLRNCDVRSNVGSGVYAHDGGSLTVDNCRINNNTVNGIYLKGGTGRISNCTVTGNTQFGLSCAGGPNTISVADSDFSGNKLQGIQPTCTITRSGTIKE